ncbi:DUF397 domain-containing protein [Actinomadura rupiterrae]|uniref:DUF397 domain-containing protein n=1 Tax=Actinomadura rupiterrae TaxID=559627 RepID=UPI0020A53110|nr:DUF397 domain-containing protein [Actinomadura rupiterrae]
MNPVSGSRKPSGISVGPWRTSSHSGSNEGQTTCVEVAAWRRSGSGNGHSVVAPGDLSGGVLLRDSQDPEGPVIALGADAWRGMVAVVGR